MLDQRKYVIMNQPNIVFILADDLGWMDTSLYGSDYYETPHIERMAARGVTFTNAYAANPLCSPTRASIQTGQYPARLGLTSACGHLPEERLETELAIKENQPNHKALTPLSITRLDLKHQTLGKVFKAAGYATGYMGKWHMGSDPYNAPQHGYDEVVGAGHFPSPCHWGYYYPGANNVCPGGADGQHLDDFVTDKAVAFVQRHAGNPFLLMLNLYDVHTPIQGKPELIEKYRAKREPYSAPQSHPVYAAMVEEVDICVGRVMDALDELGIADNTMLVFFSDNGGNMYDKPDGVFPTSNAPLRGGKANLYEGGTREPLVVVWPERIPAGIRSDALFSSVDFYPTFLEIAGIAVPEGHVFDGVSQVPVLSGTAESVRNEVFCYFPHYTPATGQLPAASLRIGDWKLIRYFHDNPDQTHRYELFHLGEDPSEACNLADREPDRVVEMDAQIEWYLSGTGCLLPVRSESYDKNAEPAFDGWRNAVVVYSERNPAELTSQGLSIDATSFGPAFLCEDIPATSGELTLTLRLQSPVGGNGQVSWYEEGQALPGNAFFAYESSDAGQSIEIPLPCEGALTALRLEPSRLPGPMAIISVCLRDAEGKPVRLWDFGSSRKRA